MKKETPPDETTKPLRHRAAVDALISGLAVISLGIIAYVELEGISWPDPRFRILAAVDLALVLVFAVDLLVSFVRAPDRKLWLRSRWFEIPGLVPLYAETIAFLRVTQLFRLTRLLRLVRALTLVHHSRRSVEFFDRLINKSKLGHTAVISFSLVISLAAIVWLLERDTNPAFNTFADSLWWAIVTTTTVGYGDITPQTGLARLFASILMVMGIGLIAVLASSLSAAILSLGDDEDGDVTRAPSLASELERIAALHQRGALSDDEFTRAKRKVLGDL